MNYFKTDKVQLAVRKEVLRNEVAEKGGHLSEKYLEVVVIFQLRLETNLNNSGIVHVEQHVLQHFVLETCKELIQEFREMNDWDAHGCIHLYLGSMGFDPDL